MWQKVWLIPYWEIVFYSILVNIPAFRLLKENFSRWRLKIEAQQNLSKITLNLKPPWKMRQLEHLSMLGFDMYGHVEKQIKKQDG